MKKHLMLIIAILMTAFLLSGCCPPTAAEADMILPVGGKKNITEAAQTLDGHRNNVLPFRARGDMKYAGFENGEETDKESFGANLVFIPPIMLYFKASSILGEAVWLGSNEEEFWLRMKPKEVNVYWWGKWSDLGGCHTKLPLSPQSMLEALGMVRIDTDSNWQFLSRDGKDVLLKLDDQGRYFKRIYISHDGYLIERIEYFNEYGFVNLLLELDDYTPIPDGSPMPMTIRLTSLDANVKTDQVEIELRNPKTIDPAKGESKVFERPSASGIKYIYELGSDCEFIQQEVK